MTHEASGWPALLGIGAYEEFPDAVVLPEAVFESAVALTALTSSDGRERSTGFTYRNRDDTWKVGRTHTGSALSIEGGQLQASMGNTASMAAMLRRPDIAMHTHPAPSRDVIAAYTLRQAKAEQWPAWYQQMRERSRWADAVASYPFPSSEDLQHYYVRAGGKMGTMVSSDQGHYLWLPRQANQDIGFMRDLNDLLATRTGSPHTNRREVAERYDTLARREVGRTDHNDMPSLRAAYASVVGQILSPRYVCYMADGVNNPVLQRVA